MGNSAELRDEDYKKLHKKKMVIVSKIDDKIRIEEAGAFATGSITLTTRSEEMRKLFVGVGVGNYVYIIYKNQPFEIKTAIKTDEGKIFILDDRITHVYGYKKNYLQLLYYNLIS